MADNYTSIPADNTNQLSRAALVAGLGQAVTNAQTVTIVGGAASRSLQAKLGDNPTVYDFLLSSDPAGDFGPAVNRCFAAGYSCDIPTQLPLKTPITFTTPGQRLIGRGRITSGFSVPASALSAMNAVNAVMLAKNLAVGPEISDLNVTFEQPSSGTAWVQYPPAVSIISTPRTRIRNFRANLGWIGIYANGNATAGGAGGLTVEDFEGSCLGINLQLDACYDSVRIINPHIWPFAILTDDGNPLHPNSTNLMAQFTNSARGHVYGRVDDLKITDGLTFMTLAMLFQAGQDGNGVFSTITGHDFDNYGGLTITCGVVGVEGGVMTLGQVGATAALAIGPQSILSLNGVRILIQEAGGATAALTAQTGAEMSVDACRFQIIGDTACIHIDGAATIAAVRDNTFINTAASGKTYTQYVTAFSSGAKPFFVGNRYTAPAAASGQAFLASTTDQPGLVANNDFGGTKMAVSSSFTQTQVGLNAGVGSRADS